MVSLWFAIVVVWAAIRRLNQKLTQVSVIAGVHVEYAEKLQLIIIYFTKVSLFESESYRCSLNPRGTRHTQVDICHHNSNLGPQVNNIYNPKYKKCKCCEENITASMAL